MSRPLGSVSPEQLRLAYDELYSQHWLPPRASLLTWLVRLLEARPGQTLLDVACGDAQLGRVACQAGLIYYGVDISHVAAWAAHHAGVFVGDGAHLPFADNRFDYVTSIGSLEHYLDMAQGVHEIARVLKSDGRACVLVPNAFGLTWNVLRVWRTGDLADDDRQPIQRFGTRSAWHRLLVQNGLEIRRTLGYERAWPQTVEEWQMYLTQPRESVLALLAPFLPLNMRRCFVFLCGKSVPGYSMGQSNSKFQSAGSGTSPGSVQ
ncbi:MAG: class I SAM-dependent methyltransferase [Anaerolineae bacterium]